MQMSHVGRLLGEDISIQTQSQQHSDLLFPFYKVSSDVLRIIQIILKSTSSKMLHFISIHAVPSF